uniref:Lymphatic vessel endothelial hyaluronan receptor 1 n=1 Tax=Latimeria chalumnae TaxID=7897 RepID=M3XGZ3_LATCH|nr:PREDICTED: lymphatic vessel endothelial hyaluronic acid receptor 1 [Latimeria chalumnae]|eukprot:XP_005989768.2 PREDICTED: lymphatic vessel endothelial hyaluronic acid receptor 1 [Latimeria chalumnae]
MANSPAILLVFSYWIIFTLAEISINTNDLVSSDCRIAGVSLVSSGKNYNLSYLAASSACQAMGISLATKRQIEIAHSFGLETCRYGWVSEATAVIARITPNEKCGRNQTGVITWRVDTQKPFDALCFNASDTKNNSCEPLMASVSSTPAQTMESAPSSIQSITFPILRSTIYPTIKVSSSKTITSVLSSTPTTPNSQEEEPQTSNVSATVSGKGIQFGVLPTVLLVLAFVFLAAAVVLGLWYIKKYQKMFPFSNNKQQKESIETEMFTEGLAGHNTDNEEQEQI